MAEIAERAELYQPTFEQAKDLVAEMGESPAERIDWLMRQDPDTFGRMLIETNAAVRGVSSDQHTFDGENVRAGAVNDLPPDQEDKVQLLADLLAKSQVFARMSSEHGKDPQIIMSELAVAIPTVLNKLHLFNDGNGRTTRLLRMVLRDADQISLEKIETLIGKGGTDRYETGPLPLVTRTIKRALYAEHGLGEVQVIDDVSEMGLDDDIEGIPRNAGYDPTIVSLSYADTVNFGYTVQLFARASGQTGEVSLRSIVELLSKDQTARSTFLDYHRSIRREQVERLTDSLLGFKDVALPEKSLGKTKPAYVAEETDYPRSEKGLPPLDPTGVLTVKDLQLVYMEAYSSERTSFDLAT